MKRYNVTVRYTVSAPIEVEADNEEEAKRQVLDTAAEDLIVVKCEELK